MKEETELSFNDKIICSKCIYSKNGASCGHSGFRKCVSCSHFYERPSDFLGWIRFYRTKSRNEWLYRKHKFMLNFNWWKFKTFDSGSIPSPIKEGDIITWKYDDELIDKMRKKDFNTDGMEGIHMSKVRRIYVDIDYRGFTIMVTMSFDMQNRGDITESLRNWTKDRQIIAINGKTKIYRPSASYLN